MKPPRGLKAAGKALWTSIVDDVPEGCELEGRELRLLEAAARQADDVQALERAIATDGLIVRGSTGQPRVHPAAAEARAGRLAVAQLVAKIRLELPEEETPGVRSARRAANARWGRHERNAARRSSLRAVS